ncbi:MAG: sulfatase [Bryobacteraceae bacterium]
MAVQRRNFLRLTGGATLAARLPSAQIDAQTHRTKPRNVVFILTDDHRYDALGFLGGQPWLRTPNMDRLAREGAHVKNAFVTTALCSPSRASILTGVYAHRHQIVDNNTAIPPGTRFFPELLQKAGYQTAFTGKWHMGAAGDDPQPGFNKWISFKGQGTYLPSKDGLNIDGKHVPQKGYITDELTDYALEWLSGIGRDQPYFLYLSHKAVHSDFIPAERHEGLYAGQQFQPPKTMAESGPNAQHRPMWVQNQRNSWHGVDFPYHSDLNIAEYYERYAETLMGVDESLGRVLNALRDRGELDSTLVIYMGDNGFAFGEHGLIDKRTAYEESMRVPMMARCPELFHGGTVVSEMVSGLDIMPTVLETAGVSIPNGIDGRSMLPLLSGKGDPEWRNELLYEYYWERNFPQTPTMHALRTDRYKYIHYYGIWDIDELYDLQEDPLETTNLISNPERQTTMKELNTRLFDLMEANGAMKIPLFRDRGPQFNKRNANKEHAADFPEELKVRKP